MQVIDFRDYLDQRGCLSPVSGAALRMAQFLTAVVAHESDLHRVEHLGPECLACGGAQVDTETQPDGVIVWTCYACGVQGQVAHWQGTLWDLRARDSNH
ncbi:MAG: hypothetical protein EBT08_00330 [Betaproteobacteria bacterium]|nr:hypothetical protein [Betaproteobacteria bacterium]